MTLPDTGYVRERQILGDPKAIPPTPPIFPVSRSAWWKGIKDGIYPKPVKLSKRTSAWKVEDIKNLIARTGVHK
ncbi:AlpA family phage regulatory protein [Methylomonas sp. SURF-2]|uniref:AlpA family phage regulatory protein n=1 Tax=Methylomonas subterranea TaxID=2952225 RepID=A0ABT1TEN2_9GAMM|nr:AlpA family phage regulatory protein [Methylomonas sp. SURF-2]MCQ8103547.1 AlpA family phage regulatory protein [Methylomonas sp. SURF-2]